MKKLIKISLWQSKLIQTIRFLSPYIFNDFSKSFVSRNGFENSLKLHNGFYFLHSLSKLKFKESLKLCISNLFLEWNIQEEIFYRFKWCNINFSCIYNWRILFHLVSLKSIFKHRCEQGEDWGSLSNFLWIIKHVPMEKSKKKVKRWKT